MMRAEVCRSTYRRPWINLPQVRCDVAVTHESDTQRFNTMVDVHTGGDFTGLNVSGRVYFVLVREIIVAPGVLANNILDRC